MVRLLPSDGRVVYVDDSIACQSTIIKHMVDDLDGKDSAIPLPLVESSALQSVVTLLENDIPATHRALDEDHSLIELLQLAAAVNYLDVPDLLTAAVKAIAKRLRGISSAKLRDELPAGADKEEMTIFWPLDIPDDVFAYVLECLGIHDSRVLLLAAERVSPAWERGARHRRSVALRVWASTVTLHEIASSRRGTLWFGEDVADVLCARLDYFPEASEKELRTADGAGWLPLHHAAHRCRDGNQKSVDMIHDLCAAYPEGRLFMSRSVNVMSTPQDIAKMVNAPYHVVQLLDWANIGRDPKR